MYSIFAQPCYIHCVRWIRGYYSHFPLWIYSHHDLWYLKSESNTISRFPDLFFPILNVATQTPAQSIAMASSSFASVPPCKYDVDPSEVRTRSDSFVVKHGSKYNDDVDEVTHKVQRRRIDLTLKGCDILSRWVKKTLLLVQFIHLFVETHWLNRQQQLTQWNPARISTKSTHYVMWDMLIFWFDVFQNIEIICLINWKSWFHTF